MSDFFEISSGSNRRLKKLRELASDGAFRKAEGEFVCEGFHLLGEALRENAAVTGVYVDREAAHSAPVLEVLKKVDVFLIPADVLARLSQVKTPQGIIFTCKIPEEKAPVKNGRYLLLDGVSDPGNLGTIIRTADAFAFEGVILNGGADPFSPKVVRSAMGATFRANVCAPEDIESFIAGLDVPVYGASLDGAKTERELDLKRCCIAIGSESAGLSARVRALCDAFVKIEMPGRAESLNAAVAAGILCYLAGRKSDVII